MSEQINRFEEAKKIFNIPELPDCYVLFDIVYNIKNMAGENDDIRMYRLDIFIVESSCSRERVRAIYDQISGSIKDGKSSFAESPDIELEWRLQFEKEGE